MILTAREAAKRLSTALALAACVFPANEVSAQVPKAGARHVYPVEILVIQGTVEVARAGQSVWDLASTQLPYRILYPGDHIRTKERSRVTIRLSDLTVIELGANAHLELLRPTDRRPGFSLLRGLLHLFHRDKPGEYYFRTPTASPVIRGTEFNLSVANDGATLLHLFEGEVALTNEFGALDLRSGDAAKASAAGAPERIAVLDAVNIIQWRLYYPAVLDAGELRLESEEEKSLSDSLAAYRRGDVLAALGKYPAEGQPRSDRGKVYLAALLLAVGDGLLQLTTRMLSRPDRAGLLVGSAAFPEWILGSSPSFIRGLRDLI